MCQKLGKKKKSGVTPYSKQVKLWTVQNEHMTKACIGQDCHLETLHFKMMCRSRDTGT